MVFPWDTDGQRKLLSLWAGVGSSALTQEDAVNTVRYGGNAAVANCCEPRNDDDNTSNDPHPSGGSLSKRRAAHGKSATVYCSTTNQSSVPSMVPWPPPFSITMAPSRPPLCLHQDLPVGEEISGHRLQLQLQTCEEGGQEA